MVELHFKQFFTEEDIKNWLLGRPERDDRVPIVPPVVATPDSLLGALEKAEKSGDVRAIQKARQAIEAHGYSVRTVRHLSPKHQRRRAAR